MEKDSSQTDRLHKIEILEVKTKGDLRKFIHLPAQIHKDHSNWVPPIYMDEWEFFDPKKNKSFQFCDTTLLLAKKADKVVGRIMGIIHNQYNESHNEFHARFAYFETWDDPEVATALLTAIENWAKDRKMVKLVGPLGFSDRDPEGLLIEGFNEPHVISSNCNFPYQTALVEQNGFVKEVDCVAYKIKIPYPVPEFYKKIHDRAILRNPGLRVLEFTSRRKVKPYIYPVLHLLNDTYVNIFGFAPFTEAEMDDFANRYLFLINPQFIKIVVNEQSKVIGFIIGMSDIGEGIRKAKGKLFPFGIFKIFAAARRSKQLVLLLIGVDPDYRSKGLDTMMGVKILESAAKLGITTIVSHLELENNTNVRSEMEKLGGEVYKRFRIFEKELK